DLRKPVDRDKRLVALRRVSTPSVITREGRILLVEDDPTTRELVRLPLERVGYTVIEATNGTSALDALDVVAPALIILNLTLPGLDAFAFLDVLRASQRWKAVPIIVMSATPSTTDAHSPQQDVQLSGEPVRASDTGAAMNDHSRHPTVTPSSLPH
ncbi:MAG: response regulator, partial [bacterium]